MSVRNSRKPKPLPSLEYLHTLFEDAGRTLRWKIRKSFNVYAGDEVRNLCSQGYLRVKIDTQNYFVHRILFKMRTGQEPPMIDHINGEKADNSIGNLRAADFQSNGFNRRASASKSGVKNVRHCQRTNKWFAVVTAKPKVYRSGLFETIEAATAAAKDIRRSVHGEFFHD